VVSGTFLIDSESKMKMAALGMQAGTQAQQGAARTKDLVCGMEVDQATSKAAGLTSEYKGRPIISVWPSARIAFKKSRSSTLEARGKGSSSQGPAKGRLAKGKATGSRPWKRAILMGHQATNMTQ